MLTFDINFIYQRWFFSPKTTCGFRCLVMTMYSRRIIPKTYGTTCWWPWNYYGTMWLKIWISIYKSCDVFNRLLPSCKYYVWRNKFKYEVMNIYVYIYIYIANHSVEDIVNHTNWYTSRTQILIIKVVNRVYNNNRWESSSHCLIALFFYINNAYTIITRLV